MRWTWHSRQGLRKIREVATALNDNCCIRYSSKQAAKQALALCAEHTDWQGPLPLPQHLTSLLSNESLPSPLSSHLPGSRTIHSLLTFAATTDLVFPLLFPPAFAPPPAPAAAAPPFDALAAFALYALRASSRADRPDSLPAAFAPPSFPAAEGASPPPLLPALLPSPSPSSPSSSSTFCSAVP